MDLLTHSLAYSVTLSTDDSLNQLQSIRESLMQMKSPTNQNFSALNTMVSVEWKLLLALGHDVVPWM